MNNNMYYCPTCKNVFPNENSHATCPACGSIGIYLNIIEEDWRDSSDLEKESILKRAISLSNGASSIETKIYNEIKLMHKKITFMYVITIASLIIMIVSIIAASYYVDKINKSFGKFTDGIEKTLDSDYSFDYDSLFD